MATTFTWLIERMNCAVQEGSYQNVVIAAGWRCNATNGTYNSTAYGSCAFPFPTGNFTPYDQLTQNQVLQWCWENGVNKVVVEANLAEQIKEQVAPAVISPPLPWDQP